MSLVYGCMDGTATSALVEARRLVEREHADIVIGPIAANEERALQGYARLRPDTVFLDGSASAHLQHQAPNFYSFHGDGAQWMAGLGTYAYRTLGWRNVVTITQEPDVFGWDETAGFLAEFCSLGGNVRSRISVAPATTDFSAIVAKVPRRRVDGLLIATPGLLPAAVIAVALAKSYPGLQGTSPAGSSSGWATRPRSAASGRGSGGSSSAIVSGSEPCRALPTTRGFTERSPVWTPPSSVMSSTSTTTRP